MGLSLEPSLSKVSLSDKAYSYVSFPEVACDVAFSWVDKLSGRGLASSVLLVIWQPY
jgi:hypothetical protein